MGNSRVGFWARLGSYLLDCFICCPIAYVVAKGWALNTDFAVSMSYPLISTEVFLLYLTSDFILGRTPAKLILGHCIRKVDGDRSSRLRLFLRFLLKNFHVFLSLPYLWFFSQMEIKLGAFFGLIAAFFGLIFIFGCMRASAGSKQALHDVIAGTAVYRSR